MITTIIIEKEAMIKGRWLRVHIPYETTRSSLATIQDAQGAMLKKINLFQRNNSIDISHIMDDTVNVKIETPLETIYREIKLS